MRISLEIIPFMTYLCISVLCPVTYSIIYHRTIVIIFEMCSFGFYFSHNVSVTFAKISRVSNHRAKYKFECVASVLQPSSEKLQFCNIIIELLVLR